MPGCERVEVDGRLSMDEAQQRFKIVEGQRGKRQVKDTGVHVEANGSVFSKETRKEIGGKRRQFGARKMRVKKEGSDRGGEQLGTSSSQHGFGHDVRRHDDGIQVKRALDALHDENALSSKRPVDGMVGGC